MPCMKRELVTQIETGGDSARFVVATRDPIYQDRLEHLGYLGIGDDRFATRWFRHSPSVPRHYGHFAASIEQMVRVPPLSAQLASCENRGLAARAKLIREAMAR
jgi:hypothetical protein